MFKSVLSLVSPSKKSDTGFKDCENEDDYSSDKESEGECNTEEYDDDDDSELKYNDDSADTYANEDDCLFESTSSIDDIDLEFISPTSSFVDDTFCESTHTDIINDPVDLIDQSKTPSESTSEIEEDEETKDEQEEMNDKSEQQQQQQEDDDEEIGEMDSDEEDEMELAPDEEIEYELEQSICCMSPPKRDSPSISEIDEELLREMEDFVEIETDNTSTDESTTPANSATPGKSWFSSTFSKIKRAVTPKPVPPPVPLEIIIQQVTERLKTEGLTSQGAANGVPLNISMIPGLATPVAGVPVAPTLLSMAPPPPPPPPAVGLPPPPPPPAVGPPPPPISGMPAVGQAPSPKPAGVRTPILRKTVKKEEEVLSSDGLERKMKELLEYKEADLVDERVDKYFKALGGRDNQKCRDFLNKLVIHYPMIFQEHYAKPNSMKTIHMLVTAWETHFFGKTEELSKYNIDINAYRKKEQYNMAPKATEEEVIEQAKIMFSVLEKRRKDEELTKKLANLPGQHGNVLKELQKLQEAKNEAERKERDLAAKKALEEEPLEVIDL